MGIIGAFAALGTFFVVFANRVRKFLGKGWFDSIYPKFLETANSRLNYQNRINGRIYDTRNGRYEYYRDGDEWIIYCFYSSSNHPYLMMTYHPNKGITKEKFFDKNLSGWLYGFISLSSEKKQMAISIIKEEMVRLIKEREQKQIRKQLPDHALEIRDGNYTMHTSPANSNEILFRLEGDNTYFYENDNGLEKFCYVYKNEVIYNISRDEKTKEIKHFYIEPNHVKNVQDIETFTKEQENIWWEMKKSILKNQKKENDIKQRLEQREKKNTKSHWQIFEQVILEHKEKCDSYYEFLSEEDKWYLVETLPKRISEVKSYIQSNPSVSEEELKSIQNNILLRIAKIEQSIQQEIQKGIQKINRLTELDI